MLEGFNREKIYRKAPPGKNTENTKINILQTQLCVLRGKLSALRGETYVVRACLQAK